MQGGCCVHKEVGRGFSDRGWLNRNMKQVKEMSYCDYLGEGHFLVVQVLVYNQNGGQFIGGRTGRGEECRSYKIL